VKPTDVDSSIRSEITCMLEVASVKYTQNFMLIKSNIFFSGGGGGGGMKNLEFLFETPLSPERLCKGLQKKRVYVE